jgi:cytochrome c biogenesis protein ResB
MLGFLRSIKLAVILISLLVVLAVIGGTLVQHAPDSTYFDALPDRLARLVLLFGFDRVFSSPLFLTVSGLFLINLSACTFHRLRKELRKGWKEGKSRFGPDLLHLGLIVLLIGGLITAVFRGDTTIFLAEEESVELPKDIHLTLLEFRAFSYEDNRPKDWISTVEVKREGELFLAKRDIEVNRPLRIAGYTIYQSSYGMRTTAFFTDGSNSFRIRGGESLVLPGGRDRLFFMALAGSEEESEEEGQRETPASSLTGLFVLEKGDEKTVHRVSEGEKIEGYTLSRMEQDRTTGLKIARDPGYPVVLIGILVVGCGLFLTYYGKIKKTITREDA